MRVVVPFTDAEYELLEAAERLIEKGIREDFISKLAIMLGVAEGTVRSRFSRMKYRYQVAREFVREYRSVQQRLYQKTGGKFDKL